MCIRDSQEIVLTGIHIASYGKEKNDIGLFELMAELQHIPGVERIRIGSLEQNIIGENFNGAVSVVPKLCPHFHLSLQSGSSSVLRRMNRKYDADEYFEKVKIIRNYFPDASITTDIIVGFPGETDEEFNETLSFVKKVQSVSYTHLTLPTKRIV